MENTARIAKPKTPSNPTLMPKTAAMVSTFGETLKTVQRRKMRSYFKVGKNITLGFQEVMEAPDGDEGGGEAHGEGEPMADVQAQGQATGEGHDGGEDGAAAEFGPGQVAVNEHAGTT